MINQEVEIKFRIADLDTLTGRLKAAGFRAAAPRTHEMNTVYDMAGDLLRTRGTLLRLREYGNHWTLTFKDKAVAGSRHKSRAEIESRVENGRAMAQILEALAFKPTFRYEKFRSEWTDGNGHVVVDETPIGNFGEIEGPPEWIDSIASQLGVTEAQYITASYSDLFLEWKRKTGSPAEHMLFAQ